MRATIIENYGNIVRIKTDAGVVNGYWCSGNAILLKEYELEIESSDVISKAAVRYSSSKQFILQETASGIQLNGLVDSIDDKVMFIYVSNSIIMLDIPDEESFLEYIGHYVEITLNRINLYDSSYW